MGAVAEVEVGDRPAAREAGYLLRALGFPVVHGAPEGVALRLGRSRVGTARTTGTVDADDRGLAELTGHPDGPPLQPVGRPATVARAAALALELLTGVPVDGVGALLERAPHLGARRAGDRSAGGGTRLLRATDGWWALNLARDADLVPALVERDDLDPAQELWPVVDRWSSRHDVRHVVDRAVLVGLPAAVLGETPAPAAPWRIRRLQTPSRIVDGTPTVVDFGALWAGPLAGRVLAAAGATVTHVESTTRPDRSADSTPAFYAALRHGATVRRVDFRDTRALRELVHGADVVIEASRPRAFRRLRIAADDVMGTGGPSVWLHITGHTDADRVAFGDDAAVAGGLVAYDGNRRPVFAGDAIADPLTGLLGALAVTGALHRGESQHIHLSLSGVAAYAARATAPG